jgi:hypothetical protein
MRYFISAAILLLASFCGQAQSFEKNYPKTLTVPSDTFYVSFSDSPDKIPLAAGKRDTIDMGTDAAPGMKATIYYGSDSVVIPYTNLPYWAVHYIPVQFPKTKKVFRLHFNGVTAVFPPAYVKANKGRINVEIPEVYELANILWTLSPAGQRATDLNKEGLYYEKVKRYFEPHMNHPIFTKLDFPDSVYHKKYYDFRENSFTWQFSGDKLVWEGPYYYVMGDDWDNYNSLFRELLPLVEDFAKKTGYRNFYKKNLAYYDLMIERAKQLMPVKKMWTWLEEEFPKTRYQSYKIVFSPLIGGSHSTQNFGTYVDGWFNETVMFICGTDRYDYRKELSDKQREGLMSGVVFTEIDHNYVNPASYKYAAALDSIFSNRAIWAGAKTGWYGTPMTVFNEYMTHSLFCLWVLDNYEKAVADYVITERENLMVNRRDFIRFKEFNRALIQIRQKNRSLKVIDLYPLLLDWCRAQK